MFKKILIGFSAIYVSAAVAQLEVLPEAPPEKQPEMRPERPPGVQQELEGTPFEQARCRWMGANGTKFVHVHEGPKNPGFEVENERDCGHQIRALLVFIHGRFTQFPNFDGVVEFRRPDGQTAICRTQTRALPERDDDPAIRQFVIDSKNRTASLEQLRTLVDLLDRYISLDCSNGKEINAAVSLHNPSPS